MPKVVPEYKAQARARIALAARAVFRRKGFRRATMDDIARELGVSKGALYLYYRTKADLLVHIQERSRDEFLRRIEGLLEGGDIAEEIAHSLDDLFSGDVDPAIWLELLAESLVEPAVRRALIEDQREDQRLMRRFLERLESRGRIPRMRDAAASTAVVLTLLQGAALRILLRGPARGDRVLLIRQLRLVLGL